MLTEFFNPCPIDAPPPPVFLAAVNPYSFRWRQTGCTVPLHTVRYLTEVAHPALADGLARAGRPPGAVEVSAQVMVITGEGEERRRMEDYVRTDISFYGSTCTNKAPWNRAATGT